MQFDLFHAYPVDEHTQRLLRTLDLFKTKTNHPKFTTACTLINHCSPFYILIIAELFHDLGKGKPGEHALICAQYAKAFCKIHQLSELDTERILWLVQDHLIMSRTAWKQDFHDKKHCMIFVKKYKPLNNSTISIV